MARRMNETEKIIRARIEIHQEAGGNWSQWVAGAPERIQVQYYGPYTTAGAATARINEAKRAALETNCVHKVKPGDPGYITVTSEVQVAVPIQWKRLGS